YQHEDPIEIPLFDLIPNWPKLTTLALVESYLSSTGHNYNLKFKNGLAYALNSMPSLRRLYILNASISFLSLASNQVIANLDHLSLDLGSSCFLKIPDIFP